MPPPKDARRLVADPNNEPNFYRISRRFPLDGSVTPKDVADEQSQAKRMRSDSMVLPQGLALGANGLVGAPTMGFQQSGHATLGAPSPSALLELISQQQQPPNPGAVPSQLNVGGGAPVSNEAAALLSILETQNQQRKEEEQQRAMLAAALMRQQQQQGMAAQGVPEPVNSNTDTLASVMGMLGQN